MLPLVERNYSQKVDSEDDEELLTTSGPMNGLEDRPRNRTPHQI